MLPGTLFTALPLRTLPFPKREEFRREWSLGSQQPGARASSFQTRCDLPVKRGETPWMPNRKDSSDTCLEFLSQETTCEIMESTPKQVTPLDKSSKERAERDDPWDYSLGEAWEYDVRVEQKKYNQERRTRPRKTSYVRSRPAAMKPSKLEPALTSDSSTSSKKGAKRERTMFNEVQLDVLLGEFHKNPYPNYSVRSELANRLDVPESRIQNWFQNRRAKQSRQLKEKESLNLSGQLPDQGEQSSLIHGSKNPQTSTPSQVPQESLPEPQLAWPGRPRFPSSKMTKVTLGESPGFPEAVSPASALAKEASTSPGAWLQPPALTMESHPCLKPQSWGSSPQSTPPRLQTLKRGQQPERRLWLEYLRQLHEQSRQYPWMQEYLEYLQHHPIPVAPALAPSPPATPLSDTVPSASASLATEVAGPETTPAK